MGSWPLFAVCIIFRCFLIDGLLRWPGWAELHTSFHHIPQIPVSLQPPELHQSRSVTFWIYVVTAYLTFAILVCGEDMQNDICRVWASVIRHIPFLRAASPSLDDAPVTPSTHSCDFWSNELHRKASADTLNNVVFPDLEKIAIVSPPIVISTI
jgi:hypothetical protein